MHRFKVIICGLDPMISDFLIIKVICFSIYQLRLPFKNDIVLKLSIGTYVPYAARINVPRRASLLDSIAAPDEKESWEDSLGFAVQLYHVFGKKSRTKFKERRAHSAEGMERGAWGVAHGGNWAGGNGWV